MIKRFKSNGKLLITSEYLVLDGADAFAIPSKLGQSLEVFENDFYEDQLAWESYTDQGKKWFFASFDSELNILKSTDKNIAETLSIFLKAAVHFNPQFLNEIQGKKVETHLDFPKEWGLGTSSTLINNIAQWAEVDPFELQQSSFPGSGYDIACAFNSSPLIYKIVDQAPSYINFQYDSHLKDEMLFVYLNKKQNSANQITSYKNLDFDRVKAVEEFSYLTEQIINAKSTKELRELIGLHEKKLSSVLNVKPIKQLLFPDFRGAVKSLGAWGGDFVLAIGDNAEEYFKSKGYSVILKYRDFLY